MRERGSGGGGGGSGGALISSELSRHDIFYGKRENNIINFKT